MKKITLLVLALFSVHYSFSQTASDYFLPLCTGNFLKFDTPGIVDGWEGRTTYHSIVQVDTINGEAFYLHKGYEVMDFDGSTHVFQCFWLKNDISGNIVMGAYDMTSTGSIDSAQIFSDASPFFTNEFLTLNYSRTYIMGPELSGTDSVVSVSAISGAYTNCIQVRSIRKENGIITMMEDAYYAKNVGIVKIERLAPTNQIYVANLVDLLVLNCYSTGITESLVGKTVLRIYPNPASDIVFLNSGRENSASLKITIYNIIGKTVKSETVKSDCGQINVRDLFNGIYFIEVRSGDWSEKQKLIIKR